MAARRRRRKKGGEARSRGGRNSFSKHPRGEMRPWPVGIVVCRRSEGQKEGDGRVQWRRWVSRLSLVQKPSPSREAWGDKKSGRFQRVETGRFGGLAVCSFLGRRKEGMRLRPRSGLKGRSETLRERERERENRADGRRRRRRRRRKRPIDLGGEGELVVREWL